MVTEEIELTEDDMYSDGYIVSFDDDTQILQRDIVDYVISPGDDYLQMVKGERLDTLSSEFYDNSKLWWKIADANTVFNPLDLSMGLGVVIPNLSNTLL